jgi:alpha-L-rhamnosidase
MNSYNHYAYGAVCQWLFEAAAGFRPNPEQPGFEHIIFEPLIIPALSPVAAWHEARTGRIEAGWRLDGDRVTYDFTVPQAARGLLVLAPGYGNATIDGQPVAPGAGRRVPVGAGRHTATFTLASKAG